LVKDDFPLGVDTLAAAVSKKFWIKFRCASMVTGKVLERIWQLRQTSQALITVRNSLMYALEIGYMLAAIRRRFSSTILGVIPKKHVQRPELRISEVGQMCCIRPEHQSDNYTIQIAFWVSR
jgi:hypothetical protein